MTDATDESDYDEREQLADSIDEGLSAAYGRIADLASEVDDLLAEYRYDAVKESIESLIASISGDDLAEISELAELRVDRSAQPGSQSSSEVAVQIPRLTATDLPVVADPSGDDGDDEVVDSLRNREERCADHIRRLFACAESMWTEAHAAARAGKVRQVEEGLQLLRQLPTELTGAYSLWELCLVDLYNENPAHLGEMGGMMRGVEAWLGQHRDRQV